jgi:hypothetical protein
MGIKSLGQKMEQCEGLLGTADASAWESKFIEDNLRRYRAANKSTTWMTDGQIESLDQIYDKHFA